MDDNFERTERQKKAIKQARNVFLILLASGLSLGVLVSIGVVKLMNYFGLTEKTNQMEIIKERIKE
ncbi:MAG: hypothetical protein AB4062_19115 [Crocosphaera sp.]